ncbi:MAG: hypothetical protein M1820_006132 [Bogoriella megaspora]|nr:MAG: hypothetical protein M1820_006132 [Bogoriella megaspora]
MSGYPQPFGASNGVNGGRKPQHQHSGELRGNGGSHAGFGPPANGAMPVPPPSTMTTHNPMMRGGRHGGGHFDGPRSPPNNKSGYPLIMLLMKYQRFPDTSHVPCKFYKQGACQAGKACPFLHSDQPATQTAPCKYFAKGNCKFGMKCALAHVMPNGQRVNRPEMSGGNNNYSANRPGLFPAKDPALTNSLLSAQARNLGMRPPGLASGKADNDAQYTGPTGHNLAPSIQTTMSPHPGSAYGSPPADAYGRFATSPSLHPTSAMDAPLPASFDSQGISHVARYGPIASSVPAKIQFDSPPSSLSQNKASLDNSSAALQRLRNSAFGENQQQSERYGLPSSSPPGGEPISFNRRAMHSERLATRPKMISASLGARPPMSAMSASDIGSDDEVGDNFAFEEDMVPDALHDLLTPQERLRRFSRNGEDEGTGNARRPLSGFGTPNENLLVGVPTKVGSPGTGMGSSPSRFSSLFAAQNAANAAALSKQPSLNELASRSPTTAEIFDVANRTSAPQSAFQSHIGSPLRNTTINPPGSTPTSNPTSSPALRPVGSPSLRPIGSRTSTGSRPVSGDLSALSGLVASRSPPHQSNMSSMSIISQQLNRTRLDKLAAEDPRLIPQHPGVSRALSGSSIGSVGSGVPSPSTFGPSASARGLDRAVSSSSIGRSEKIEEETGLFDMEGDGEGEAEGTSSSANVNSKSSASSSSKDLASNGTIRTGPPGITGTYADHARRASGNGASSASQMSGGSTGYWPWPASSGQARPNTTTNPGVIGGQRNQ